MIESEESIWYEETLISKKLYRSWGNETRRTSKYQ